MTELECRPAPLWIRLAARVIQRLPAGRYRAANWAGRAQVEPFWAEMPEDLGRMRFQCDLRDPIMREACLTGRYEPQETILFRKLLAPGMTFVDVGANWGYFTLVGAHLVGPSGRVVSVEADPRACDVLRRNAAANGLRTVRVVPGAASDRAGTLAMWEYQQTVADSRNFGVAASLDSATRARRFDVDAFALDVLLDRIGIDRVDLLKMDIEGAEGQALDGLSRRLSQHAIEHLVLELHPAHLRNLGMSADTVIDRLRRLGYRGFHIDHSATAYKRAATVRGADGSGLLDPLEPTGSLDSWPHVLWTVRPEMVASLANASGVRSVVN
jgi:FkbM family methyltransferase